MMGKTLLNQVAGFGDKFININVDCKAYLCPYQ